MSRFGTLRQAVGLGLTAITLAVYFTYPLAPRLGSVGRVDTGDGQFSVWNVAWVAHAILSPDARVWDTNIFYPRRGTLAYSEPNLGAGLLAVPVYALTRNPHAAHNSAVLIGLALSVVGMFLLVRRLGADRGGALLAAVLFSFCPFVFARTAHIQLLMFWPMPFMLLALHAWVESLAVSRALLLGVAIAVQALFCSYFGVLGGLIIAFGVLFYSVSRGLWRRPLWWAQVFVALATSVVVVLPFFLPYLGLQRDTGFARPLAEAQVYAADWRAYFASSARLHEWMLPYLERWKEVLFPGFTAILLGITGAVAGLRSHSGSPAGMPWSRETTLFYVLIGILALWCSFGPAAGLYGVLYHAVPVFSLLRAPARFGLAVSLALAVLAGGALGAVTRRLSVQSAHLVAGGVLVFAILELSTTMPYREVASMPRAYEVLASVRPGAVAVFPFHHRTPEFYRHSEYMLASSRHWLPMVNGYSDYIPPEVLEAALEMSSFPNAGGFAFIRPRRVRYAVFHLALYDWSNRQALLRRLDEYREYLRPLVKEDDVWLYEIVAWPGATPTSRVP